MAATDIVTVEQAIEFVGISASDADATVVGRYVTAASEKIDDLCGPVVLRTVTDERLDGGSWSEPSTSVWLQQAPVLAITSVTEHAGGVATTVAAELDTTVTGNRYLLDAASGKLTRRYGGCDSCWATGRRNIKVTYSAGRYDPTVVDPVGPWPPAATFAEACLVLVRHWWTQQQSAGTRTYGSIDAEGGWMPSFLVPRDVVALLGTNVRLPAVA